MIANGLATPIRLDSHEVEMVAEDAARSLARESSSRERKLPDRRIALAKPPAPCDEKVQHSLLLLESILWAFKGTTRTNWIVAPPESADVVVVHQDDKEAPVETWRSGGKRLIEISTIGAPASATSHVLVYPFRPAQVLVLLERIDAELSSAHTADRTPAAPQAAAPTAPTVSTSAAPTDPWAFVESLRTLRAVENGELWLVGKNAKDPVLWLKADCSSYIAHASIVQDIRLGKVDFNSLKLAKGTPPGWGGPTPRPGVELSWFAGYYASGQLAPWLNPAARYRITRWPNFGEIRPVPSHIRVAAVLSSGAANLAEIASRARVSRDEAARTLNALATCDVVTESNEVVIPQQRTATPIQTSGGLSAFLRNVRKHLGLGS